jgi:glucosamine--fructose-6-phosphate aminotransferase (isomerizing)
MGGIFCATARDDVVPSVMQGLRSLERPGCDSFGLGMLVERQIQRRRAAGPLSSLEVLLADAPISATTVIGHTRWATHGERCRRNAHPHASSSVAVVHSGVVENHSELRAELGREGVQFRSETDSEVIVWLLNRELAGGAQPMAALRAVLPRLQGSYALAVICAHHGDCVYAARRGVPLSAGRSAAASWLSTDEAALGSFARETVPLEDGQIAELSPGRVRLFDSQLDQRAPRWHRGASPAVRRHSEQMISSIGPGEILVQPAIVERVLSELRHDVASGKPERWCGPLWRAKRVLAVGSGASYHAAHVGRAWLERIAGIPVELELSSELEMRNPILEDGTMALLVSHSEEDEGALAALAHLKKRNVPTVVLTNVAENLMTRDADAVLDCGLGQKIGNSCTQAFVAQLGTLAASSIAIRRIRDGAGPSDPLPASILDVPDAMNAALDLEDEYASLGRRLADAGRGVYLGRGANYPLASVGALQLEALSQLPAEGLAGGELEHSSPALTESRVPVILVAPSDGTLPKTLSDARDVIARGGEPMLLGDTGSALAAMEYELPCLSLGPIEPTWAPMVLAIALQLVAYHAARVRDWQLERPSDSRIAANAR